MLLLASYVWVTAASAGTAAPSAFYHPDDIAAKSARFAAASDAVGPKFDAGQKEVERLGKAVDRLELGSALLGPTAPPELTAWATTARRQLSGQYLRLQKHVALIQDDFSNVFGAALERALPKVPGGSTARQCASSKVAAMMGSTDCQGQNLNAALAAALDADATLAHDLTDIESVEWPSVKLDPAPQAVVAVTGTERWVSIWAVAEKFEAARLLERENTLQAALEAAGTDSGTPDAAAIAAAQAAKQAYVAALGTDGATLRDAAVAALARQKDAPAGWGWCANPKGLGGCPGEDVTVAALDRLAADKKFLKAVP